ncbi:MAG: serine/threonine protein kinase [Leptolyngbya sp. PLA1]|nr:serine/threonine protein kinase [Leptolyngbya sp. PLA1]
MTRPLFHQAQEVFHKIISLPPGERQSAIDRECDGNLDLASEVRSLLEFAADDGFMDAPALGTPLPSLLPVDAEDDLVGTALGPYTLLRRIDAGGMGVVYEAQRDDEHLTQRVAIKVVKRGMDSEEVLRRFRAERRTLAALSHPGIARLLDAGVTPDARPYLVMEFVDGTPIDLYCAQRGLPIDERVRLFRRVCDAVRAAHQSLVVHRDLKPSNILVTPEGEPKLLDFGIAKVLGPHSRAESVTAPQFRRLTPEYASPEQIRGLPITTASDVYSLGVVLFEVLTGVRPYEFHTRSFEEIERVVCGTDPTRPSLAVTRPRTTRGASPHAAGPTTGTGHSAGPDPQRLSRTLRGDLDTIILACLHRDLARRYPSVEALVEDIDRYLARLPIKARKDTIAYRASKFVRRNPVGVSLGSLSCLLLLAGGGGIAQQADSASRQRDSAYVARDQAEKVADFFRQVLEAASPDSLGPDVSVRDAMEQARERAQYDLQSQPLVQASVRSAIGRVYVTLGEYETAEQELTAALNTRLTLLPEDHHDLAESKMDMGFLRLRTGNPEQAERLFREALDQHVAARGEENEDTSRAWNDWGTALRALDRTDEAIRAHERALAIRRGLSRGEPSLEVAESLNNLAGVYLDRGDAETGERLIRESLLMREALLYPAHPLVLQSNMNLATMLGTLGRLEEALPLFESALAGARDVYPARHPAIGHMSHSLGTCYFRLNRLDAAARAFTEALSIREETLAPDALPLAITEASLGRVLAAQGDRARAITTLQHAIDRVDGGTGPLPAALAPATRDLVRLLDETGESRRAAYYRGLLPEPAP